FKTHDCGAAVLHPSAPMITSLPQGLRWKHGPDQTDAARRLWTPTRRSARARSGCSKRSTKVARSRRPDAPAARQTIEQGDGSAALVIRLHGDLRPVLRPAAI